MSAPLIYNFTNEISQYTNVLLIDRKVTDYHTIYQSVNSSTLPIVYSSSSSKQELFNLLKSNFSKIQRLGLVFESTEDQESKLFLDNELFFQDNESVPYSDNVQFIINLIREFGLKNIDYLACNTYYYPNWVNYYSMIGQQTGVVVGASDKYTGNSTYGGDWVLESTGEDIEFVYFTDAIENYRFLLASFPISLSNVQASGIVVNGNYMYVADPSNNAIHKINGFDASMGTYTNISYSWATGLFQPSGIAYSGNYLYITNSLDFKNTISRIGFTPSTGVFNDICYNWVKDLGLNKPTDLVLSGNYMYVVNNVSGTNNGSISRIQFNSSSGAFIDISNSWVTSITNPKYISVYDQYMFVSCTNRTISQIKFTPSTGTFLSKNNSWKTTDLSNNNGLSVYGNHLFVCNNETIRSILSIPFDISTGDISGNITQIISPLSPRIQFVTNAGNYLYFIISNGRIFQQSLTDFVGSNFIYSYPLNINGTDVVSGNTLYVTNGTTSVNVSPANSDISGSSVLTVIGNTNLNQGNNNVNATLTYDGKALQLFDANVFVDPSENLLNLYVTVPASYAHDNSFNVGFNTGDVSMVYVTSDPSGSVTISRLGKPDISFNNDSSSNAFGLNSLDPLHNPFTVTLKSKSGMTTKSYPYEIYVEPDVSLNFSVNGAQVGNGSITNFTYGITDFSGSYVTDSSNQVWVKFNNDASFVPMTNPFNVSGLNPYPSLNTLLVNLSSYDGLTTKQYNYKLYVDTSENLLNLLVTVPASYEHDNSFNVGFGTPDVSMVYVTNDPSGSVTISRVGKPDISFNNGLNSNAFGLNGLDPLHNPFTVMLTSESGLTTKSYPYEIYVEPDVSLNFSVNGTQVGNGSITNFTYGTTDFSGLYITSDPSNQVWVKFNNDLSFVAINNTSFNVSGLNPYPSLNTLLVNLSSYDGLTTKQYNYKLYVDTSENLLNLLVTVPASYAHDNSFNVGFGTPDVSMVYVTSDPSGSVTISRVGKPDISFNNGLNSNAFGLNGLDPLHNPFTVKLTSESGLTTKSYPYEIYVEPDVSLNFLIDGTQVGNGSITNFTYGTTDFSGLYITSDPSNQVWVKFNNDASFDPVTNPFNVSGLNPYPSTNNLLVNLSSYDGLTTKQYNYNLYVDTSEILIDLLVTVPASNKHDNSFNVGFNTSDVSMIYVTNDPSGSVTISRVGKPDISFNNDSYFNYFGLNGLDPLHNPFTVKLTSESGLTTKSYPYEIYVEPDVSLDLSVNGTSMVNGDTKNLSHSTSTFTARYATTDPSNVVWYQLNNDGSYNFTANTTTTIAGLIDSSLNTFLVNISSYDFLTTKTYTYYLYVQPDEYFVNFDISGSVIHYLPSGSTYYNVKYNTTDISGYYVTNDPSSTVILDFSGNTIFTYPDSSSNVFSLSGLQPLNNTLNFTIKSYDGITSKPDTRNVYVERDVFLTQFVITRPTLNYPYSANTINVPYGTTDISGYYGTLNANYETGYTGGYTEFDFSGNVFDLSNNLFSVGSNTYIGSYFSITGLKPFNNDISLTVFSATGLTSETFSKRIYVEAEEFLTNLAVDGVYFASGYIFNIPYGDHNVTLTFDIVENDPIDFPSYVNITVNGVTYPGVTSPFIATGLDTGSNHIVILVSSEDNLTQKTYFLTVYVEASCLLEGTLVWTNKGYVPIETLKPGDTIETKNYYIDITKVGKWSVDLNLEEDRNDLSKKMYKIPAGRYGAKRDTYISHYHRFMYEEIEYENTANLDMKIPEQVGLVPANPAEFAKDGKYNLYHLQLAIGNHYYVNGGCIVEAWEPNAKHF